VDKAVGWEWQQVVVKANKMAQIDAVKDKSLATNGRDLKQSPTEEV
jgi:hypothetical protein